MSKLDDVLHEIDVATNEAADRVLAAFALFGTLTPEQEAAKTAIVDRLHSIAANPADPVPVDPASLPVEPPVLPEFPV